MIIIEEKETKQVPGITSLFVTFPYHPDLVEIIKTCDGRKFNKKTKIWEVATTNLAKLLDAFCDYDEVTLKLLPESVIDNTPYPLMEYRTSPYPYQLEGIQYGLHHPKFLLLDGTGLGKTLQIIYLAQERRRVSGVQHCLIICGINTLKTNWKKEIERHSDLSCRILGQRKMKKSDRYRTGSVKERIEDLQSPIEEFFVITNIESLRNEELVKNLIKSKDNTFDMLVLDEAHMTKNKSSAQGAGLLKLSAPYMVAATASPIMNDPLDAYVPLSWIGMEQSCMTDFKYYYTNFVGEHHDIKLGYKNLKNLKHQLEFCSLRRTKDILDLPPKTVINEYVEMSPEQWNFYLNITEGVVEQVDKVELNNTNILAMISRLRQATACPSILTTENIPSAKADRACEIAEEVISQGYKVVIFSTFKDSLNPIMERLAPHNALLCTGDVKDSIVSDNIDKFQTNDECKVLCATWQKCGTGITLTAASYAIFLDTPWTAATYGQAQDRIYRIGTKDAVFIYNLICTGTVDERVLDIVDSKEAISDYIVDDKISPKSVTKLKKFIMDLQNNLTD